MRCIEIFAEHDLIEADKINRNMRCIEINLVAVFCLYAVGLIET